MARSKLRRFHTKARRNSGKLPGLPKGGRPPGVPWSGGKKNPSAIVEDLTEFILPGFGGFALTRAISRIAMSWTAKRKPTWAKHVGVLSSLAAFAASWLLAHRVKALAKYQQPLMVGAGIATFQTAFQAYIPKYGWLVGYPTEDLQLPAASPAATGDDLFAQPDDDSYLYDEALDANPPPAQATAAPSGSAAGVNAQTQHGPVTQPQDSDAVDDILAEMESDADYQGVFSN